MTNSRYQRTARRTLQVPTRFPSGSAWERAQHFLAIGGPVGFIPWVPATWASLFTAAVCWWVGQRLHPLAVMVATALLFIAGGFACSTSERLLESEDPRNVVLDEIAGQLLTFVAVTPLRWTEALAGFVLFRVFDVWKPFPIRRLERLHAGWGIMADDLGAGLYAAAGLWLVHRLIWIH